MIRGLDAQRGNVAEMMSIPFQQTARYLQLYRYELTPSERQGIEAVLGNVEQVARDYDPAISDPVKAHLVKGAGARELAQYMKAWVTGLIHHPKVYVDAFLLHVYGWFDPGVVNTVRYEAYSELFPSRGLFPDADKFLIFFYSFSVGRVRYEAVG